MENPAEDMRDSIAAAFDAAEKGETVQDKVIPELDDPEQVQTDPVATAEPEPEKELPDDPPAQNDPPAPVKEAPSSWKPEAKAEFNKLPPGIQDEVLRRESDYHKGIQGYKEYAQTGAIFAEVVKPFEQTIKSLGVDAPTAIKALLQADHTLRYSDPATKARYFGELAQQYGINLEQVANPPQIDPQYAQMQQQLQMTQQEVYRFKQEQEKAQQSTLMSEIQKFAADPANAHFEAVKQEMSALLQAGQANDLKEAYEKAVWMRPDIRQSLIDQQRAEAQKKALNDAQRKKVQTAASASVKGSTSARGAQPGSDSIRAMLESQFAE